MKTTQTFGNGRLLAVLAGLLLGSSSLLGEDNVTSLIVTKQDVPIFPQSLLNIGVDSGSATVLVNVDANGELVDRLLVDCTHRQFGEVAYRAVANWEFEPARRDGVAVAVAKPFTFNFEAGKTFVVLRMDEAIMSKLNFGNRYADGMRTMSPSEIDSIPQPREIVRPGYPETMKGRAGHAVVEFYIDREGQTRIPVIVEASHPDFAVAAAHAVLQWRFDPATVNGRPVLLRAKQRFDFDDRLNR